MNYTQFLEEIKNDDCHFCPPNRQEALVENENAFMTYAVGPYYKDHLLILPKRHVERYLDLTEEEITDMNRLKKEAFMIFEKLGYEDMSFLFREGPDSGKSMPHVHYHAIPKVRLEAPGYSGGQREALSGEDQKKAIERIKSVI